MNAHITHFTPSAYRIMPWKNGAGSTTELLISPRGSSVQAGFDWRISLAQVPASGPFSCFPDYQRTIMLLRGDPMQLVHQDHGEHLLQAFQPYDFHGALTTTGILTGQPVEDFNVMIRDHLGRASIEVYRGTENTEFPTQTADQQFIWSWSGEAKVAVGQQNYEIKEQESLLIESGTNAIVRPGPRSTLLIIVNIFLAKS
ncbi:MAG TPA: HutD family protein [Oligoflexus sp.]|uniref:HutD/Ves family protein n=1 Tax=Oligoflexus sp. TaxID=1971216 RepID=UPI002D6ACA11|nr:HutD family protein [Oligoflexus sp.]HYX34617.1 HutD family protein [Oligoflexus sp.]